MGIPRIYTPQPLQEQTHVRLDHRAAHHVSRVLRLGAGSHLRLFNGDGREYSARILATAPGSVAAATLDASGPEPAPELRLTLIQGISRGERMDFALQKAVELGVHRLVPIFSERSVVHLDPPRLTRRMAHWHGVVISACEQCGRCYLPQLDSATRLSTVLTQLPESCLKLLLHQDGDHGPWDISRPQDEVIILIGPEGGLSGPEQSLARRTGFTALRLGPRILRTETAPLAALAALQTLWGDFR